MLASSSHSRMRPLAQDAYGVLQHWTALGSDICQEASQSTAVLAALSFWDYSLVADIPGSEAYKATGRCFSVASGRISYAYALKGALQDGHARCLV